MPAIILWLSRHTPTPAQRAELERLYPGHELKIDKRSFDSADDIVARVAKSGATDIVVVAPLSFVRELVRRGLHPLWAEMRQVTRGSPSADSHHNGRSYRFIRFNRIRSVEVKLEPAAPLPPPSTTPNLSPQQAKSVAGEQGLTSPSAQLESTTTTTLICTKGEPR